MNTLKIKPPTYLFVAIIVAVILDFVLPMITLIPTPWTLLGLFPLIAGILINLNAEGAFHQAKTAVCPFDASSVLVTEGPYRFTRNPMYLGFVLMLMGASILLGSLTPFGVALVFALLMDRLFIQMEEQKLAQTFGPAWEEYKSHTRRWL